jgi:hypothetical protein
LSIEKLAQERIDSGNPLMVVNMESALDYPADLHDETHPNAGGYAKMWKCWNSALQPYLLDHCGLPVPVVDWKEIGTGSASCGGISASAGTSSSPSLATDADGAPIIAWSDNSNGNYEIYVRKWQWDATNKRWGWDEMGGGSASDGGISNNNGSSKSPSLAVSKNGVPVIAWSDDSSGDYEIYVKRYNKTNQSWDNVGASSASGMGISNTAGDSSFPSLAFDSDGDPVVAWEEATGEAHGFIVKADIYLKRWKGGAWGGMDGSASPGGISKSDHSWSPSLAINPVDGEPIVAWTEYTGGEQEIYLRKWGWDEKNQRMAWIEMGNSASLGGVSNNGGGYYDGSDLPSLAIDSSGTPIVGWRDGTSGNLEIYVKRWNKSLKAWVEMGGSAHGPGISYTGDDWPGAGFPSLALDPGGAPIVAWEDTVGSGLEVYVKRWNGAAWVELGDGSASGGGISNTGEASIPSLAIGGGRPIVAWPDRLAGDQEIFIRRGPTLPVPAPTPTPPSTGAPELTINHNSGSPGSFFTVNGSDFPAGEEATVAVNGNALSPVAVGGDGRFNFILDTAGADEGYYLVTATVNPKATTQFELAAAEPAWPKQGTAPVIEVPSGIAFTERLFLPLSIR